MIIEEENGKCLTCCIQQNGRRRLGRGEGIVKGQESRAHIWSSNSVPGMGCLLRADAVMLCLWSTVLSGCSGLLLTASVCVYMPEGSFLPPPVPMTVERWGN